MSQHNVDLFRQSVAAANAREVPEDILAADFRIENGQTAVTDKTYHGPAGVREWMSDFFDAFDEGATYEIEEIIADGEDFVVGAVRFAGRGAGSGVPLELRWVSVAWFRDGKATRVAGYSSRPNALEAVGLKE